MNYQEATTQRDTLQSAVDKASAALNAIPGIGGGPCGLTPDAVKESPEFRATKRSFERAFNNLRAFNAYYVKVFKKEIAAARAAQQVTG